MDCGLSELWGSRKWSFKDQRWRRAAPETRGSGGGLGAGARTWAVVWGGRLAALSLGVQSAWGLCEEEAGAVTWSHVVHPGCFGQEAGQCSVLLSEERSVQ